MVEQVSQVFFFFSSFQYFAAVFVLNSLSSSSFCSFFHLLHCMLEDRQEYVCRYEYGINHQQGVFCDFLFAIDQPQMLLIHYIDRSKCNFGLNFFEWWFHKIRFWSFSSPLDLTIRIRKNFNQIMMVYVNVEHV